MNARHLPLLVLYSTLGLLFADVEAACSVGTSPSNPARSCHDVFLACGEVDTLAWISPVPGLPYEAYCGPNGYTLAMQLQGDSSFFTYDSSYWTSKVAYKPSAGLVDAGGNQLLEPFIQISGSIIFIEMTDEHGAKNSISIPVPNGGFASLVSLFASNEFIPIPSLQLQDWLALMPNAGYETGSARVGINNFKSYDSGGEPGELTGVRIGILMDDDSDFSSPDTAIGVGFLTNPVSITSGSYAESDTVCDNPDGFCQSIPALTRIFVGGTYSPQDPAVPGDDGTSNSSTAVVVVMVVSIFAFALTTGYFLWKRNKYSFYIATSDIKRKHATEPLEEPLDTVYHRM